MKKIRLIEGCYYSCPFFGSKPEMHCDHPHWDDKDSYKDHFITHENSRDGKIPEECPLRNYALDITYKLNDKIYLDNLTPKSKYELLIGMIEGCMDNDESIVATEEIFDSLIKDLGIKIKE